MGTSLRISFRNRLFNNTKFCFTCIEEGAVNFATTFSKIFNCLWKCEKSMGTSRVFKPKLQGVAGQKIHHTHTRTHTHPFKALLSGSTRVSRYQKGKTDLNFTEARDSEWQWHQLGLMQVCISICKSAPRFRQITTPAPHYSSYRCSKTDSKTLGITGVEVIPRYVSVLEMSPCLSFDTSLIMPDLKSPGTDECLSMALNSKHIWTAI